jgi:ATP-dependent Clp protease ATP-binding subunit ClpC
VVEGLDRSARSAVDHAVTAAHELGHSYVGTEHLLLGLLAGGEGVAVAVLRQAGATPEGALAKVVEAVGRAAPVPVDVELGFTARGARAVDRASRFSLQRRAPQVGPGDLLLGVLDVEGTAGQVLRGLAVDVTALRGAVQALLTGPPPATGAARSEQASGSVSTSTGSAQAGPSCAGCGAALEENLAHRPLASTGPGERRQVVVAYCSACGATIGVLAR